VNLTEVGTQEIPEVIRIQIVTPRFGQDGLEENAISFSRSQPANQFQRIRG
jgi:hypothetical protein